MTFHQVYALTMPGGFEGWRICLIMLGPHLCAACHPVGNHSAWNGLWAMHRLPCSFVLVGVTVVWMWVGNLSHAVEDSSACLLAAWAGGVTTSRVATSCPLIMHEGHGRCHDWHAHTPGWVSWCDDPCNTYSYDYLCSASLNQFSSGGDKVLNLGVLKWCAEASRNFYFHFWLTSPIN